MSLSDLRILLVTKLGGPERCKCQWPECQVRGEKNLELHHLINRGRTQGNEAAREKSEVIELVAMLCQKHHHNAHTPAARRILLRQNVKRFGLARVQKAIETVDDESVVSFAHLID